MERHKCKLCSRSFANGRALGGHMKGHFATLPLPPKPEPVTTHSDSASLSYSSSSEEEDDDDDDDDDDDEEKEEKGMVYGLIEKPKKSFRLADPKFSFPSDTVVQYRESETESKNPTRKRSKRNRKYLEPNKKSKLSLMELSPVSSVSEAWPEEDVAMCLMMLSRDTWKKKNVVEEKEEEQVEEEKLKPKGLDLEKNNMKLKRVSVKHNNKCDKCGKTFRSSRASGSHKSICSRDDDKSKIFECPFCYKVFGSGQALGGHKRSHLIPSSSSNANNHSTTTRFKDNFIDLNLPAQPEEDDLSVVSDA